jgi:hypothetical protein
MKNNCLVVTLVISALLLSTLCVHIWNVNRIPTSGECSALSQLPLFGTELPTRNIGQIRFVAEDKHRRLFAKVNTTAQNFEELSSELKLSVVRYKKGFDGSDLLEVNKEFRPVGTRVWCGFGILSKDGRTTVRFYFEPLDSDGLNGVLYIHLS